MQLTDKIQISHCDNMELMAKYPDKHFELAIVDPPYGIGFDEQAYKNGSTPYGKRNDFKFHKKGNWDKSVPCKDYFLELFRVSKNQIIWGGNYFSAYLPVSKSWIVWDKMQYNATFSDGELAWSSFGNKMRIFRYAKGMEMGFAPGVPAGLKQGLCIHPTQKPIGLYKYLLSTYANAGDKILDTHLGSGSIAIACHDLGFELTACELDKDYYEAATARLLNHVRQGALFNPEEVRQLKSENTDNQTLF